MLQKEICVKENEEPVNTQEGQTMVEQIRALSFVECSAKTQDGIRKVFQKKHPRGDTGSEKTEAAKVWS